MAYTNIDDPSAHFQVATWSGSGSTQSITFDGNSDMQPDWTWTKPRGIAFNHSLQDTSRGIGSSGKTLSTNLNSQDADINDYMMTFNTNGFSVGAGDAGFNASNDTYVSWCWKVNGGTTSTNSDGDINSTVQVNSDAGVSIVQHSDTSNGNSRNIGHGLGVTPSVVITRARNRTEDWRVFHIGAGSTGSLILNDTSAHNSSTTLHTGVASSTFGVGTDYSVNGTWNYISYVFADKQGFSKHGKYVGNGTSSGKFVYTGFKPRWIMLTRSDTAGYHWRMYDTKRSAAGGGNPLDKRLNANLNEAEGTHASDFDIDALSNGFKIKTSSQINVNNGTYVYMCFAEQPFVTSTGIPATAR